MPSAYAAVAADLTSRLDLDLPPIGLALVAEPPPGIPRATDPVPSACTFWRRAERGTFFAAAEDHLNCPIGMMVMGFDLPEPTSRDLMGLVEQMCELAYLQPAEVPHIPKFERAARGIVYGPLGEFPLAADVALVWATPFQAMLLGEAVGAVQWSSSPGNGPLGRPACGALPSAVARSETVISFGCLGMRTFTEIPADRLLVAIPGAQLDDLADRLATTLAANDRLGRHYQAKRESIGGPA